MNASYPTLISARELAEHIGLPDWRVIDCRHDLADVAHGRLAYADAHLPGAHFLHLDEDLSGPTTGRNGRHPLPDPAALVRRLARCGVDNRRQVVAYDDSGGIFAARLWWLLRWLGHDRVAVLDGGYRAWCATIDKLEREIPEPEQDGHFDIAVRPGRVSVEEVEASLGRDGFVLVDARSPDRYRGENETLDPVAGHVPGARNRFFRDNLDEKGFFKSPPQLAHEFRRVIGHDRAGEVVHMCGSGVTACHNLLAMEIAGLPGSRLYAGSWSEWCSAPQRPVATGNEA